MKRMNKWAWTVVLFLGALQAEAPTTQQAKGMEDRWIIQALLSEEKGDFRASQSLYLRLYDATGKVEYLIQAARDAMMRGGENPAVIERLQRWIAEKGRKSTDRQVQRLLAALYARSGKIEEAERIADRWLAGSEDPRDLKLAATLKIDRNKVQEAVELLERAYAKSMDERIILQESTLLEKALHDRAKAIRILESHLRMHPESTESVYFRLIELYAKEKNAQKVLDLYKRLYQRYPSKALREKIIKLSLYLHDFDGLASLLEKEPGNEELLYMLYKEQNRFDKAIALARKRYRETKNPKWLAEEAILTYEEAKEKKRVDPEALRRFQELFERALKEGADESLYLNYYGYTLIDHDRNVDRGIELVRRALKQDPDNLYYLDSLAWGLYKKGRCAEAYRAMKRVAEEEGTKIPEINEHWQKIQACRNKGK